MKAFLDHYGWRWMVHRPEERMFSKQAVCISTAAGGGMKSTVKDMADSTFFWGCAKTYKPGIKTKAFFTIMRMMQKNGWNPADKVYWEKKGWLGKKRPWK